MGCKALPKRDDARHLIWLRDAFGPTFVAGIVFHNCGSRCAAARRPSSSKVAIRTVDASPRWCESVLFPTCRAPLTTTTEPSESAARIDLAMRRATIGRDRCCDTLVSLSPPICPYLIADLSVRLGERHSARSDPRSVLRTILVQGVPNEASA